MERMIENEYRHNERFRNYVDRYANKCGIEVSEALGHEVVRQAYFYYTEV